MGVGTRGALVAPATYSAACTAAHAFSIAQRHIAMPLTCCSAMGARDGNDAGFRERSSAFDLKAVLDDFVRFLDRQKRAEETSAVEVRVRTAVDDDVRWFELGLLLCLRTRTTLCLFFAADGVAWKIDHQRRILPAKRDAWLLSHTPRFWYCCCDR